MPGQAERLDPVADVGGEHLLDGAIDLGVGQLGTDPPLVPSGHRPAVATGERAEPPQVLGEAGDPAAGHELGRQGAEAVAAVHGLPDDVVAPAAAGGIPVRGAVARDGAPEARGSATDGPTTGTGALPPATRWLKVGAAASGCAATGGSWTGPPGATCAGCGGAGARVWPGRSALACFQTFTNRWPAVTIVRASMTHSTGMRSDVEQQAEAQEDHPLGALHEAALGVEPERLRLGPLVGDEHRGAEDGEGQHGDVARVAGRQVPGDAAEEHRVGEPVGDRVEERAPLATRCPRPWPRPRRGGRAAR